MKPVSIFLLTLAVLILAACSPILEPKTQSTPLGLTDTSIPIPNETASPVPTTAIPTQTKFSLPDSGSSTPSPVLWAADNIPEKIVSNISFLSQMGIASDSQQATLILGLDGNDLVAQWVYVLAAPFPTILDEITSVDLQDIWEGGPENGPFTETSLLVDQETYAVFTALWGASAPEVVQVVSSDKLLQTAWENQPSWAIVPFEALNPRWKVLQIDGVSPIQKDFNPAIYPLTVQFYISGESHEITPVSNYDGKKMTDLMLTGVTALVRGTALTMERKGITYPGEDIAPITRAVDFMHVNNEIPFTPDCPFPDMYQEELVFCSDIRYLDLLEDIGVDFVELSGDHFGDHGTFGTLFTLDLYDEVGLPYYGGGRDLGDGRQPLLLEHNGNKIAILGCNAKGSQYYAPADENTPGAVPCDFDWMEAEIVRLKGEGYLVIVTFQHVEYYSYEAQPDLVRDFGRIANAGAAIVSGSQSHQAHGMAFVDDAFIHYGLGNLFFDQYQFCQDAACDYGFMDRHIIYDGRHISTELIPIRFIDMARPRPMTAEEKAWFLDWIFEASGW
jgi:poly-gamma-glutamate synthesis protein (capsule biosynthesis protein)